jgi:phosphoribosylaminoimidazole-succinocarboxamide synthase
METFAPIKKGKVREVYDNGDSLIIVASDRISAFDEVLNSEIPEKGKVLTQMSRFWFDFTSELVPNHMISVDNWDMPEFFQQPRFRGRTMLCKKLEMIPVECVVRGYLTGSAWEEYQERGKVAENTIKPGLKECEKLPKPIFTPTTKGEDGEHDEPISYPDIVLSLERKYPGCGFQYAEYMRNLSIGLYQLCADYAEVVGVLIADTKFEFGVDENGTLILADEMLTPDSSRFWPKEGYEPGKPQPSYDKQFVRDWLKENPDNDGVLPQDVIDKTIKKYKLAYQIIAGQQLL